MNLTSFIEKLKDNNDFFASNVLYPMAKRKFHTLRFGAVSNYNKEVENGNKSTTKLKEMQKLLATVPKWNDTDFIDQDCEDFKDLYNKKFKIIIDNDKYVKKLIHNTYNLIADNVWDNITLLSDRYSEQRQAANIKSFNQIIFKGVKNAINNFNISDDLNSDDEIVMSDDSDTNEYSLSNSSSYDDSDSDSESGSLISIELSDDDNKEEEIIKNDLKDIEFKDTTDETIEGLIEDSDKLDDEINYRPSIKLPKNKLLDNLTDDLIKINKDEDDDIEFEESDEEKPKEIKEEKTKEVKEENTKEVKEEKPKEIKGGVIKEPEEEIEVDLTPSPPKLSKKLQEIVGGGLFDKPLETKSKKKNKKLKKS